MPSISESVHDFNIPDEVDGRSGGSDSSDDSDDGYPGYDAGLGLLQPWPKIYRLVGESAVAGNPLPCLPEHGG
jgi:hypothetical protein